MDKCKNNEFVDISLPKCIRTHISVTNTSGAESTIIDILSTSHKNTQMQEKSSDNPPLSHFFLPNRRASTDISNNLIYGDPITPKNSVIMLKMISILDLSSVAEKLAATNSNYSRNYIFNIILYLKLRIIYDAFMDISIFCGTVGSLLLFFDIICARFVVISFILFPINMCFIILLEILIHGNEMPEINKGRERIFYYIALVFSLLPFLLWLGRKWYHASAY